MMRTIRQATEADLPAVLDLYADAGFDYGVRLEMEKAQEIFRRFATYPSYRLFVAVDPDGKVAGTYALLFMDNIAHIGKPLAIVEQVAVAASNQGTGLGTLMMRHAMDQSRAHGCYKMALSSNVKFDAAHRFYEGLGFTRHGYSFVVHLEPNPGLDIIND
ncbi:MAG: GNAT family N-acetyltransferase [Alphaproteobacteria bacterium]|nr:GNAT family N-acetyltransferase [Alphaproteobacteria bacterium]